MPKQASVFKSIINKSDVSIEQLNSLIDRMNFKLKQGKISREEYVTLYKQQQDKRKKIIDKLIDDMQEDTYNRNVDKEKVRSLLKSYIDENAEEVLKGI